MQLINNNSTQTTNNTMAAATTAIQVNPFHDDIDLTSSEGKKLCQKATRGLPEDQKHKGDPKDVVNFM